MKLTFFGAAHAVTGSCHCVECGGKKILVDCGLQQGQDEKDNQALDFNAGYIDAVVVTHAHIDHSGRIPLLVKQGFAGNIYCTRLTGQLLSIMLRDSAHIQESDAQWANQKGRRAGEEPVEPLYTVADAEEAVRHVVTCEYGTTLQIADGVKIRFVDAGHLLGSSSVEMWLTEGGETRKVVFSGDIGNRDQPIIRDPQYIGDADYVLTESTYGDRLHDMSQKPDYTADLAAIIDETLGQGGNVIIPSFAVGRTQELLYFIREMKEQNLVKSVPDFTVVVDSPLAGEATRIFSGDLHGYLDEEAIAALKGCDVVVLLNKCDLDSADDLYAIYTAAGFPTLRVSAETGEGIEDLKPLIAGKLSAFTGNSGVGKSSILNALDPEFNIQVGDVSQALGRGRHTTRHVELFHLNCGADVVDSPGFSSFETDELNLELKHRLPETFVEFRPYLDQCRFVGCSHTKENGCAVLEAVREGKIQKSRHASYVRLYEELKPLQDWQEKKRQAKSPPRQ